MLTAAGRSSPASPRGIPGVGFVRRFDPSCDRGVGSSAFTWPFNRSSCFRLPPLDKWPPRASAALGVPSNDEQPGALMRGTHVGSSYNAPSCNHPHFGKVGEDPVESESKVACDILSDNKSGS